MTRHFIRLYVLVVVVIAGVSWLQERLWMEFGPSNIEDASHTAALRVAEHQLRAQPKDARAGFVAQLAADTELNFELFDSAEIAGATTLDKLRRGEIAVLTATESEWLLKQVDQDTVIALQHVEPQMRRGALEWSMALLFYAAIALVVVMWLWPLTRDLRELERATASFGNRNWLYRADIKPQSQIYSLAETFRRMAARIDGLIASHKDMSNAVSHEIKTPLSRMRFELEAAERAGTIEHLRPHLAHIQSDIADLDALVAATLDYAILERADLTLNLAPHDFTQIVPAIADYARHDAPAGVKITSSVDEPCKAVVCDAHLMETVIKNLVYNALRHAATQVQIAFWLADGRWRLDVDDDGPGVPEADRQRVFGSFVQLGQKKGTKKSGFGLGLAIVKRAVEWHGGSVEALGSPLGGARFAVSWPASLAPGHPTP